MFNLRDIGGPAVAGGRVRHGMLWRSNALVELGDGGDRRLAELGLRVAIDLREPGERTHEPSDLTRLPLTVHTVPLVDGDPAATNLHLAEFNAWLLSDRGPQLTEAVRLLAGPEALPAVYFCSSGKDRTGLLSALVLSALGAEEADIVADYALSETLLPESYKERALARALAGGLDPQGREWFLTAGLRSPAPVMATTLATLREKYGGAGAYLRAHGLSDGELARLREAMVAPEAGD